jgi:predicted glutamine amidotransferase
MCRWVAYVGAPVFLEDFIARPCQSLIAQSIHCREAKSTVNADGFGLAWYGERPKPGLFRDVRPAWSDENLLSIAHQIRSRLFFAHVRASTGTATTRTNCHPFAVDQRVFMHNGQVPEWSRVRRRIEAAIPDDLYKHRAGSTDSEALFLLMLANGLAETPQRAVTETLAFVEAELRREGVDEPVKMTAAVTDGDALHAVRYATHGAPPTLYTKSGDLGDSTLVVSEPLDGVHDGWVVVPPQSFITVRPGSVDVSALMLPSARSAPVRETAFATV